MRHLIHPDTQDPSGRGGYRSFAACRSSEGKALTEPQPGPATHKFAVVLNKKIPPAAGLNACAHMTATLVARADDETRRHMSFVDYTDADGNAHPVSALSLVVLSARNSSQLRTARLEAIRAGLSHVDFTETMTQDTFAEQMARTQATREEDLDYWGLGMFGPRQAVDPITRKFSLWRI
jgi:hypothetical protein